jgi:hypothetical protein
VRFALAFRTEPLPTIVTLTVAFVHPIVRNAQPPQSRKAFWKLKGQDDASRESAADLDLVDSAVFHFIQPEQQSPDLSRDFEIDQGSFGPRRLIVIEFDIDKQHGCRSEDRFSFANMQLFDTAIVDGLAKPNQNLARRGDLREAN